MAAQTREQILADKDISRRLVGYWKDHIASIDQANRRWHKRCDSINKRYKDERNRIDEEGQRRFNLLWTNIQIMRPAVYGRCPVPNVERRFLDRDPIARVSSQILERVLRSEMEDNGFHGSMKRAVMDYLLCGRGVCWVRYEPEIGASASLAVASESDMADEHGEILKPDESEGNEKLQETGEQILAESAPVDYIQVRDFYIFPSQARTWEEVQAIGKKVYLSKEECMDRFGREVGKAINPDVALTTAERMARSASTAFTDINERERVIYEIWNKSDRRVYWVSTGYDYLCDIMDDPLELKGFFPVPEPLSATLTNDSLIPTPDYIEYQDQAIQIDELTQRISQLTKQIKMAGCYDAANMPLRRLLDESVENELIPVDDWVRFGERGGIPGAISMIPLSDAIKALETLIAVREKVLEDVDRVTGMSDILRGTSDPRETLGGVRLKTNNATTRLDDRRAEVARFARDLIRIIAEIAAKHFTPQTLVEASGILHEDEMQPAPPEGGEEPESAPPPMRPPQGLPMGPPMGPPMGALPPPNITMPPLARPPQGFPPPMGPALAPPVGGAPATPPPAPMLGAGGPIPPHPMPPLPAPMGPPPMPMQPPHMGMMPQPHPMASSPAPLGGMGLPMFPIPVDPMAEIWSKIEQSISLLRNDITRGYRIDIETDSTIAGDAAEERTDAVEFITAITTFLEKASIVAIENPSITPILGKILQFGVRKFRTGRDLESAIDDYVDRAGKQSKKPQDKGPSPEELKMQAISAQSQLAITKANLEAKAEEANDRRAQETKQLEHQIHLMQVQMENEQRKQEHQMRLREISMKHGAMMSGDQPANPLDIAHDQAIKQAEIAKAQADSAKSALDARALEEKYNHDQLMRQIEHESKMRELEIKERMARHEHHKKMFEHMSNLRQMDADNEKSRHEGEFRDLERESLAKKIKRQDEMDALKHRGEVSKIESMESERKEKKKKEDGDKNNQETINRIMEIAKKIHKHSKTKMKVVRGPDKRIIRIEPIEEGEESDKEEGKRSGSG